MSRLLRGSVAFNYSRGGIRIGEIFARTTRAHLRFPYRIGVALATRHCDPGRCPPHLPGIPPPFEPPPLVSFARGRCSPGRHGRFRSGSSGQAGELLSPSAPDLPRELSSSCDATTGVRSRQRSLQSDGRSRSTGGTSARRAAASRFEARPKLPTGTRSGCGSRSKRCSRTESRVDRPTRKLVK